MIEFGLNFLYSIQCADREHCTILFVNKNISQIVATFSQANGSERKKIRLFLPNLQPFSLLD